MGLLLRLLLVFVAWILLRRALRWGLARMTRSRTAPPRREPDAARPASDLRGEDIEDAEYEELP